MADGEPWMQEGGGRQGGRVSSGSAAGAMGPEQGTEKESREREGLSGPQGPTRTRPRPTYQTGAKWGESKLPEWRKGLGRVCGGCQDA